MAVLDQSDHSTILDTYYKYGKAQALYPVDDTMDLVILDADDVETSETHAAVPVFYHCAPDAVLRANGALEGAMGAFTVGDKVVVRFESAVPLVVGRYDGLKPCIVGLPVAYTNGYSFIGGAYNPPSTPLPEYDVSGEVRQLHKDDGLRLQMEAECVETELQALDPSLLDLTITFYVNEFEVTDKHWTYANWFATTGIPNTWRIHVTGESGGTPTTPPTNYAHRIRLKVKYTHGKVIDYDYGVLQLVGRSGSEGHSYHYEEDYHQTNVNPIAIAIDCADGTKFAQNEADNYQSQYFLVQLWGWDGRYYSIPGVSFPSSLDDFFHAAGAVYGWLGPDPPCSDKPGCNPYWTPNQYRNDAYETAVAFLYYSDTTYPVPGSPDPKVYQIFYRSGRSKLHRPITGSWTGDFIPSGECDNTPADSIEDIPWPDTLAINWDAPAGTPLGDLLDEYQLRDKWTVVSPIPLALSFNDNHTEWTNRPY